jgi:hypothetical protein
MALTQRARALTAVGLGAVLLALVIPYWWELVTTDRGDRAGRSVLGFYLPLTAVFGVPGLLLLVLGLLAIRKERQSGRGS